MNRGYVEAGRGQRGAPRQLPAHTRSGWLQGLPRVPLVGSGHAYGTVSPVQDHPQDDRACDEDSASQDHGRVPSGGVGGPESGATVGGDYDAFRGGCPDPGVAVGALDGSKCRGGDHRSGGHTAPRALSSDSSNPATRASLMSRRGVLTELARSSSLGDIRNKLRTRSHAAGIRKRWQSGPPSRVQSSGTSGQ